MEHVVKIRLNPIEILFLITDIDKLVKPKDKKE